MARKIKTESKVDNAIKSWLKALYISGFDRITMLNTFPMRPIVPVVVSKTPSIQYEHIFTMYSVSSSQTPQLEVLLELPVAFDNTSSIFFYECFQQLETKNSQALSLKKQNKKLLSCKNVRYNRYKMFKNDHKYRYQVSQQDLDRNLAKNR